MNIAVRFAPLKKFFRISRGKRRAALDHQILDALECEKNRLPSTAVCFAPFTKLLQIGCVKDGAALDHQILYPLEREIGYADHWRLNSEAIAVD